MAVAEVLTCRSRIWIRCRIRAIPRRANREDAIEAPVSAYGRVKLETTRAFLAAASEGACARWSSACSTRSAGCPRRLLRPSPGGRANETTLHTGSLESYRDYVDVRRGRRCAGRRGGDAGGTAASSTSPRPGASTRHLLSELLRLSGRSVTIEETGDGSRQSAAVDWQEADITRAAAVLGWRPRFALDQTLIDLSVQPQA